MLTSAHSAVLRFLREEDGASLVEYALLVALIAVVCIGRRHAHRHQCQRQVEQRCHVSAITPCVLRKETVPC